MLPRFCRFARILRPIVITQNSCTRLFASDIVSPHPFTYVYRKFPDHIRKPIYFESHEDDELVAAKAVSLIDKLSRDSETIEGVGKACAIAKNILNSIGIFIKPGLTGEDVDDFVYRQCLMHHCYPSPLHFGGFPKCVTISTNNVVVHGIPDSRPFREGDLVSVDVSIYSNGYHGDTAVTFLLGKDGPIDLNEEASHPDQAATRLLRVGRECLTQAINVCKAGVNLKDVARLIDRICTEAGFSVIPAVCGHSIGEYLHGPPEIVHAPIDLNETEMVLRENMLITLEPAICEGEPDVELLDDGWTVVTSDNSRAVQFEHTILVQKMGALVLT